MIIIIINVQMVCSRVSGIISCLFPFLFGVVGHDILLVEVLLFVQGFHICNRE